jgi:anti-anti-sigma factor
VWLQILATPLSKVIAMSNPLHECCPPDAHGVVSIRGEIDVSSADLSRQLAGLPDPVLLDLSQVGFIDCSGLAIFLAEQRRRATAFRVVATSRAVDRLLEVARLELATAPALESVS